MLVRTFVPWNSIVAKRYVQDSEREAEGYGELFFALHVEAHDDVPGEDGEDEVHECAPC